MRLIRENRIFIRKRDNFTRYKSSALREETLSQSEELRCKGEEKEKSRNQREGISEYRVKWKGKRKKGDTFADTILFRGVEKEGKESRGGIVVSRQGEGRGTRREGATSGGRRSTDVKSWGNKKSHPYSLTRGGRAAWLIKACDNKRREGIAVAGRIEGRAKRLKRCSSTTSFSLLFPFEIFVTFSQDKN